jgi:hypothetical protein
MPKSQERKLRQIAAKYIREGKMHGVSKGASAKDKREAIDRFSYGVLRRQGWKPTREKK